MTEIPPKSLARFKKWLLQHYTERTARKYLADVQAVVRYNGVPPHARLQRKRLADYRLAFDIWEAWGGGERLGVARPEVPLAKKPVFSGTNQKIRGGRRAREAEREPTRLREHRSWAREDYDAILDLAEQEGTVGRVLVVIGRTGLRVGDVLRTPVGLIREGLKRHDGQVVLVVKGEKPAEYSVRGGGKAEKAWRALVADPDVKRRPGSWTVAAALMDDVDASPEAGQGAYERVRHLLERLGKACKAKGRIHLHRFRRSVAVYLLAAGATEDQVRRVLVQSSVEVLREYTQEARALESAKLLTRIE